MRIESLCVENFKAFKDILVSDIPSMAVFVGRNGVGKTTFFDIFGFLHDCLESNVKKALMARGGFREVISRGQEGDIKFKIQFRTRPSEPLITYELSIGMLDKEPIVKSETLKMRRGEHGSPWKLLDFKNGEGIAVAGDVKNYSDVQKAKEREKQKLESPDILAIKGLGQFQEFPAIASFRRLIEDWYVSNFKIDAARAKGEITGEERVSVTGDNLQTVTKYIKDFHPAVFRDILVRMEQRVPGIKQVEAKETEDGYIILKFQDGKFKDPFSAKFVSDGTIKMFAYLVLLNEPKKHALLCVEEPENQLYPELLSGLAEEFRAYSSADGQVFVSTHSPDFLNAVDLKEVFVLSKKDGFTSILRANDNELLRRLVAEGDKMGFLWNQNLLDGV